MILMKIMTVGGKPVSSGIQENPLTLSDKTLFSALLEVLTNPGSVDIQYRIPANLMQQSAWNAGTFTTGLIFTVPGGVLCLGTSNPTNTFSLVVDPFTVLSPTSNITLSVNDFKYYRNTTISASHSLSTLFTVPLGLNVSTSSSTFNYTNGYIGAINPNTSTSNLSASITAPSAGSQINLNTTPQALTTAGGIVVPVGNTSVNTVTYGVTPTNLTAGFLQAGSYTTTLKYEAFNAGNSPNTTTQQMVNLNLEVADMGAITVNNAEVTLALSTQNDYLNGVAVDIPNHLTISKTSAYDVYVKAASDNLVNGTSTLPVSCISIGAGSGQTGINPVSLSSTAQKIITGAAPCLDRSVGIQYSIPAEKIKQVLGHPAGTYSTTITYSFVAL